MMVSLRPQGERREEDEPSLGLWNLISTMVLTGREGINQPQVIYSTANGFDEAVTVFWDRDREWDIVETTGPFLEGRDDFLICQMEFRFAGNGGTNLDPWLACLLPGRS